MLNFHRTFLFGINSVKLAYSYIRFSSLEQAKGDSFRRQTALAQDYCNKNSLQLADLTLRDLGKSAYHGTHFKDGALGDFIDAVKSGSILKGSYLLVESMECHGHLRLPADVRER